MYDTDSSRIVDIQDMPIWYQIIGKKKRPRIDVVELAERFDNYANIMGVGLMVIEAVGGRPKQGAGAGFVFGFGVGIIHAIAVTSLIPLETVPPAGWKKLMNVPGKAKADDSAILARADELFPLDRHLFRGPKGGKMIDRAEAAMLAKFGGDFVLRTLGGVPDKTNKQVYMNADTGA